MFQITSVKCMFVIFKKGFIWLVSNVIYILLGQKTHDHFKTHRLT